MRTLIFLSISLLILSSCSDDSTTGGNLSADTSSFTYPFNIGSTWNYDRIISAENFRPDSIRHYFSMYPFSSSGSITISHDTVINGVNARCFIDRYKEVFGNDSMIWSSRFYYGNNDTALVCFAFRSEGAPLTMPYSVQPNKKFEKNGRLFNSVNEALFYFQNGSRMPLSPDSLYIENPPSIILKYPIITGTEWVSKYIEGSVWSTKKYESFDIYYMAGQFVRIVKTKRVFTQFTDVECYDYHTKYGQVKRDYLFKNLAVTDSLGYPIGYADIRELSYLTSYSIVSP